MTYLEAVNKVLLRMREPQVSAVSASNYSRLVGQLVNEAKREVEDAHGWQDLRTLADATVTSGDTTATFLGTSRRTRILKMYNDTEDEPMYKVGRDYIVRQREYDNYTNSRPCWWSFRGHDS